MDDIDGTGHYERSSDLPPPSLLAIVLDTNPYAWSTLAPALTISKAVADLLVFINAHLAFNHANKVVVIASHCGHASWLYPSSVPRRDSTDEFDFPVSQEQPASTAPSNPNKYRPFALIEHELLHNLEALFATTDPADLLNSPTSTMLSGALTLALSYINKTLISLPGTASAPHSTSNSDTFATASGARSGVGAQQSSQMSSRILIVSASGDLAAQYIPIMNLIFAAQHSRIPIDILKLAGDSVLLQQASFTTSGIFLSPSTTSIQDTSPPPMTSNDSTIHPSPTRQQHQQQQIMGVGISLLPTLLFAFLPDTAARQHLIAPTGINVDFRAACFCHRRVVDIGFVCSICLSIFCEEGVAQGIQSASNSDTVADSTRDGPPRGSGMISKIEETGSCLTCGTMLSLRALRADGSAGTLSLHEQPRLKKKKKKRREGVETPAG